MVNISEELQRQKYLEDLKNKKAALPDYDAVLEQQKITDALKGAPALPSYDVGALEEAQTRAVQVDWITWKDFVFPPSITKFNYEADTKVATYEYAMRDGAEHERVASYKVFRLSGIFIVQDKNSAEDAFSFVQKLQETDDNKPGILKHKDFGEFLCIMKSLKIEQAGDSEQRFSAKIFPTYTFDLEFWEHTPDNSPQLKDLTSTLFPAPSVKPPSNNYLSNTVFTEADYKNYQTLFYAIKAGKIKADPSDANWKALYVGGKPTQIQKDAFDAWTLYQKVLKGLVIPGTAQKTWTALYVSGQPTEIQKFIYTVWNNDKNSGLITSKGEKWYVVKQGDDPVVIAKKFKVSLEDLWNINRGIKVRNTPHDLAPPVIGGGTTGGPDAGAGGYTPVVSKNWDEYRRSIGSGNVVQLTPYYKGTKHPHHGADILGKTGDKIYAFAAGKCVRAEYIANGFGLQVYIRSKDGFTQIYGHLSSIVPAEDGTSSHVSALKGQEVVAGQVIGGMGCSGRCFPRAGGANQLGDNTYEQRNAGIATHLHFEVRNASNVWVEPVSYVNSTAGLNVGTNRTIPNSPPTTDNVIIGTGTDGYYWNTMMQLWPGDRIKIP